ncbi:OmpA family protein [Alteriqipengyuania sp. WL0013]|uniref:OmpA family protein n=1 Tax=Alteriqipengyuania sp. WL0013 TaxID=3110773 RepID=UPI002BEAC43C|nr:OmpA family protein [Alteriqipengyuania sp. WL0013]MEB3414479.1 OmpA family protein [Alteriqipengyuania sp. WL0013]
MMARNIGKIAGGAVLVIALGWLGAARSGPDIVAPLEAAAAREIAANGGVGVTADFTLGDSWLTRHPILEGGERLPDAVRADIARAVDAIPGVGGISWGNGGTPGAVEAAAAQSPLHCQEDVEALLRARSIRFEESSAAIERGSVALVDEVAEALRPCLGAIIAITGHTDRSGPEPGNIALSGERAAAVRDALMRRGIPADGLRIRGVGSREPVEGLDPADPANRRIEFDVVATVPLRPTPIDTPGPR